LECVHRSEVKKAERERERESRKMFFGKKVTWWARVMFW